MIVLFYFKLKINEHCSEINSSLEDVGDCYLDEGVGV